MIPQRQTNAQRLMAKTAQVSPARAGIGLAVMLTSAVLAVATFLVSFVIAVSGSFQGFPSIIVLLSATVSTGLLGLLALNVLTLDDIAQGMAKPFKRISGRFNQP